MIGKEEPFAHESAKAIAAATLRNVLRCMIHSPVKKKYLNYRGAVRLFKYHTFSAPAKHYLLAHFW